MPLLALWKRLHQFYTQGIWRPELLADRSLRGRFCAVLRVVSITITGLDETKTASRAASLSFATLLGLGPLMAITVLVAGFVLDRQDPNLAVNTLNKLLKFVAPQVAQYEQLEAAQHFEASAAGQLPPPRSDVLSAATLNLPPASTERGDVPVNPELVKLIDGFIAGSRSSTAGVVGVATLIMIVLQLFTSVENAFNEIWGVRQGRSWLKRVVYYWTVVTLGAVLFFAIVTTLSAGAFLTVFEQAVPFGFGPQAVEFMRTLLPSLSIVLLVMVLVLFYKFIPHTRVSWVPAAVGAAIVGGLVVANNYLAFLYLSKVVQQRSLFGSLGIFPILMFGLYVFWFFLLLGGQVSYAVQNVGFRNSQAAWNTLAETMRERLSLTVLLRVGRRFCASLPPVSASALGAELGVPRQILNECLSRLVRMRLLSPVPASEGEDENELRYLPARPLDRLTLADFKRMDDGHGGDPSGPAVAEFDPIVSAYDREIDGLQKTEFFRRPLSALIDAHPLKLPVSADHA
jgi:membrane protein